MTRDEVCSSCDSTSLEMCLIRRCPLWAGGLNMTAEEIKAKYEQEWIQRALKERECKK